jgi:mRNA interferase MazF
MAPRRGEVWLFDLGMAAKVRPALVISVEYGDLDRALTSVVPHTTSLRGSRFEVAVRVPFLQPGAFLAQGIVTQPSVHAIRKLGALKPDQFAAVVLVVAQWLGLREGSP